jgi:hypothetical protein
MGNGLLAWWRRRIVARGLAGAALFAVPVAVAALIGFGTSISGVAGGLSAVTNGPDAVPASAQPAAPSKLNRVVVALANKQDSSRSPSSAGGGGGSNDTSTGPSGGGGSTGSGTGTGTGSGASTGSESGSGTSQAPTINVPSVPNAPSVPSAPSVPLPGGGSTSDTTDAVNGTVNNVLNGVNNTLNGLLGK